MSSNLLRIGVIGPPWIEIPPTAYGGTELAIDTLVRGLAARGHDVTLFTVGTSSTPVRRKWIYDYPQYDDVGSMLVELRHTSAAYRALDGCDIIHDHTVCGPFMALCTGTNTPIVATNHGPFTPEVNEILQALTIPVIGLSHAHASQAATSIQPVPVIHHGLVTERYRFNRHRGDGLVALGRMNPGKGIESAITFARQVDRPLTIAAKMRDADEVDYYKSAIEPLLGSDVTYVGEVNHDHKVDLLANAFALVNLINWPEPFGLVMIEALACGTPVIATKGGVPDEIIEHRRTGYLMSDPQQANDAISTIETIDRENCWQSVQSRFSMNQVAAAHELFYNSILKNDRIQPIMSRPPRRYPGGSSHGEWVLA